MNRGDSPKPALAKRLGANIRKARHELGLTQEQLAGEDMTRNMLSQIENGSALPSLTALCLLAERLGLPPGALLGDLAGYHTVRLLRELRGLLVKKHYSRIIERFDSLPEGLRASPGAELAYILKQTFVARAFELFGTGAVTEAGELLDRADSLPETEGFDSNGVDDRAFTLRLLIDSAVSKSPSDADMEKLSGIIFSSSETAIYLYVCAKLSGAAGKAYSVPDEKADYYREHLTPLIDGLPDGFARKHLKAKLEMVSAEYLAAKALLVPLLELELPPSLLCDLYTDLEHCCKCCGDFENAYKYSTLKLELVRRMK